MNAHTPYINPIGTVAQVLEEIFKNKDELEFPIESYMQATGGLKRLGVSFLILFKKEDKKELVPVRVDEEQMILTRFCSPDDLKSWHGKPIHTIKSKKFERLDEALIYFKEKLISCLRNAWNRFQRKLQKNAQKKSAHNKSTRRCRDRGTETPFRRFDSSRMKH